MNTHELITKLQEVEAKHGTVPVNFQADARDRGFGIDEIIGTPILGVLQVPTLSPRPAGTEPLYTAVLARTASKPVSK